VREVVIGPSGARDGDRSVVAWRAVIGPSWRARW
jgi:hypothetical protein